MASKTISLWLLMLALLAFEGTYSHQEFKKIKVIQKVFNWKCPKQCKVFNTELSQQLDELRGKIEAANTNVTVWKGDVDVTTTGQSQQLSELRSFQGALDSELRAKHNALESNQTQLLSEVQTQLHVLGSKLQATLDDRESELQERLGTISSNHSQQFTQLIEGISALESRVTQLEIDVQGSNPNRYTPQLPELQFTAVYGERDRVVIEEAGAAVRDENALSTYVRTDGALTAGRHYWEMALTWTPDPGYSWSGWLVVAAFGVRRNGSDFSDRLGLDNQSWAVEIQYDPERNQWRYRGRHDRERVFKSTPVTYDGGADVTNRLGLLLDTEKKTMTSVNINNNTSLFTFRAVDGSTPLVPAVAFLSGIYQRRFRLTAVDTSRLPETVTDLLHNS